MQDLAPLAGEKFLYLTTTGRRTRAPHEIEIWFGMRGRSVYMLSGGRDKSDWVRNLTANPSVTVRLGGRTFAGSARIVNEAKEDAEARRALLEKYEPTYSGDLKEWGATALPIAVDLGAEIA
jgi:deazaflavin-dependent oxidoreductase (nitroreductase family)